jgi:hypothetical protein
MVLAALIISIFALVVAMMTLPQIIWGKPKIKVYFTCIPYDGLICMIQNMPIESLPYSLGVYRQDVRDLCVKFEIYDKKASKRMFWGLEYRDLSFGFDNKPEKHATLPASMTKMIVYIVKIKPGADFIDFIRTGPDNIIVPLKERGDQCSVDKFEEGNYEVHLNIYIGHKCIGYVRDFVVSYHYPYVSWVIDDIKIDPAVTLQNAKHEL